MAINVAIHETKHAIAAANERLAATEAEKDLVEAEIQAFIESRRAERERNTRPPGLLPAPPTVSARFGCHEPRVSAWRSLAHVPPTPSLTCPPRNSVPN